MKKLLYAVVLFISLTRLAHADTSVVFNEIMYHPATNEAQFEWVELRNQMAVDVDLSGWSITGGSAYTFASNTIVRGGGFVLIASSPTTMTALLGSTSNVFGPFTGTNRLGNNGDTLRLRNNSGRVVDEVSYGTEGDWPVAPDGSGVSLAKRDRDSASGPAENWTISEQVGGTPGAENFVVAGAVLPDISLVAVDAAWKYEASGTDLGTAWRAAGYNDTAWGSRAALTNRAVPGLFNTGVGANGVVLAGGVADPHYLLTAAAQGTVGASAIAILNHPAWLPNNAASSFIGVVNPGETSISGGNYHFQTTFSLAGFIPGTVRLNINVAVDNVLTDIFINGAGSGLSTSGFAAFNPALVLASGFVGGVNTLEFRTVNEGAGPGGFRATLSGTGLTANTNAPLPLGSTTYYFRKSFTFAGDPAYTELRLNSVVADGAVVYLNGVEVYRQNMPAGPVTFATPASSNVVALDYSGPVLIPAASLLAGANVLAVEVHQATGSADGPLYSADLIATPLPVPPAAVLTLAFNELSASTNAEFWLELVNYGTNSHLLDGCVLVRDGAVNNEYVFPAGPALNSGGYRAITNTTLGFHPVSGDKLYLLSPARNKVLDAVVVKKAPRGRSPGGTGPYLFSSAPTPGGANSFALHNGIVINEIMYSHRDVPGTNGLPQAPSQEEWLELHNQGASPVDLTGWELDGGITYRFFNQTLAPGGYLVVAKDAAYLRSIYPAIAIVGDFGKSLSGSGDTIILRDPSGNPANRVRYFDGGRWPAFAGGGGSSLELRDPTADNTKGEAWAASNEAGKTPWQTYSYRMVAAPSSTASQDATWRDFIFGLLGDGETWIDDLSVIQSPTNGPIQVIANGNFESGLTGWRVLGNHIRSSVELDPDNAGNHVLRLVATGPQEHMNNHIETTLTAGRTVVNGTQYEISFRARHIAGNNLVNTRFFFNRVARSTPLVTAALNGTPGARNSTYATNIGPTFAQFQHAPVVPAASIPVTVSVAAQDAQGVSACAVWWSVGSGAWSNAPMTLQPGGNYSGTIPGFAAATIVQFYVRAVDGLGAVSMFPAAGPASGALYKVADGQANLALTHNVRIVMTPANTALLHADTNVMSNDLLPCTVIFNENRAYYDVGVHLKSSEHGRNDTARVGFHLVFQPDDLFRGVHPVMLIDRSNSGRPTCEEILLRHMALQAGVPMTHPDICRVIAPQNAQTGQAILSPRYEDDFMETAFENGGDGTLYELELIYWMITANAAGYKLPVPDVVQGLDFSNLGNDKEAYRYAFILKNHRNEDNYDRFIAFAKSWSLTGAALEPQTRLTTDWDAWMRSYSLVSLMGVGDMYTFGNNHNLMAYLRPSDQKMVYFLWDMDFSFNRAAGSAAFIGDQNLGRIVNAVPSIQRCFYAHLLDHVNTVFNPSYMTYWFNRYDDFTLGASFESGGGLTYIQQRGDFAKSTINGLGGNAAFAITGTNFIVTSNNLVTLTGTAPVQVKTIWLNGVEYPVTWTSFSGWTLRIPVSAATNVLNLVGYDVHGNPLTNFSRTVTVNYTGATPSPDGQIVFNEIMYDPAVPDASYLELFNTSATASFDLSGWRVNGIDYTFPPGSFITNRQFLVLARSLAAYTTVYSNAPAAFDQFEGALQNDGETLALLRPGAYPGAEIIVDQLRYEAAPPWPVAAHGAGPSLQLIDAAQDNRRVANWSDGAGWRLFIYTNNNGSTYSSNLSIFLTNVACDVYLDDISFVTGTVAGTGTNYIVNGGFETPLSPSWIVTGLASGSAIESGVAHSGSNSLHLVYATGAAALTHFYQVLTNVVPPGPNTNTIYTLSFWYLPGTNSLMVQARINASFRTATDVRSTRFTPGAANSATAAVPAFPSLWLNEAQPENLAGPLDSQGEREPWVELHNSGTTAVSLAGCYLSKSYSDLAQWAFPSNAVLQPGEFKIIFADGETNESTEGEWHAGFRLTAGSGSVALNRTASGAVQVLDYLNYTNLPAGRSYGDFPDAQPFFREAFYRPTPSGTNDNLAAPLAVFINEWMARNNGSLVNTNNDNKYDDWFELHNPGAAPADVSGYFLTDNLADPFQFAIPPGTIIPPFGFLLVWADGEPGLNTNSDSALHASFKLEQTGEAIALFASDGVLIDAIQFGPQTQDTSEGRYPDGPAAQWIAPLSVPTPLAANALYANRYPALAAIPDATAYVNLPFQFTAAASDPDMPPQILAFTLPAGLPTNATLHAGTGAFSWTPVAAQADTTNVITVRVTDNGAPALSADRTFTVIVRAAVLLGGITAGPGGSISFSVLTTPGKTYRVEYKNDLNDALWIHLPPDRPAAGTSLTVNDTIEAQLQRFYRVIQLD